MSRTRRVFNFITGLFVILGGSLMVITPRDGYYVVVFFLSIYLIIYGLRQLILYIRLARFMVGGKLMLVRGVMILDFGYLSLSLADVPRGYVLVYLLAINAFSGIVGIMRALEARRYSGRSWRRRFFLGVANIIIAIACLFIVRSLDVVCIIYGLGLISSGIVRISLAFKSNRDIYISAI